MTRWETFTFRLSADDRKAIDELAYLLRRTRADTLRQLIKAGLQAFAAGDQEKSKGIENEHSHKGEAIYEQLYFHYCGNCV